MSKTTSVVATAAEAAGGKTTPKAAPAKAAAVNGSPAPAATAAEPVNGEVAPPASNRVTIRSDRQPANVSMAQLALQMSKRSGERRGATSTAPAATSRSPQQQAPAEEAETPAEEVAETGQVEQADAGVNESTEVLPQGALGEGAVEETPEGAAPEGAELEPETEAEAEAEVLPKNVKDLQARVNKLTARAKQAEAKLAAAQGAKGDADGSRRSASPTAGHPELQAIEGQLAVYREALEFAEANPDGGEYTDPATGHKTFYDAARVRTIRRNAEEGRQLALSDKAALQRQIQTEFVQARHADQTEAVKAYPWLAKKPEALTETEAQMVTEFQQILQMQPSLKQAPDCVSWIADAVAGRQARLARATARSASGATLVPNANAKKPPSGSRTPPAVVTRAAAAAPKVNPAQAAVKAAEEKFRKTGHARDYEKLLSAQAAARRQAH